MAGLEQAIAQAMGQAVTDIGEQLLTEVKALRNELETGRRAPIKLYSVEEVAELFGVNVRTVYKWLDEGYLKHSQMGGKTCRIKREWIEEALDARAIGGPDVRKRLRGVA